MTLGLRRPGLLAASALLVLVPSLPLFGGILGMYLFRTEDALIIDRLLPNYFAYYQDLPLAPILILFLLLALLLRRPKRDWPVPRLPVAVVAVAVLILCYVGTWLVFDRFALSRDEFMADFDAQILRSGALFAPLPDGWRGLGSALLSDFVVETRGAWASGYLPGNAALRAAFGLIGDSAFTGPMLAAASIGLVHGIARKLIPEDRDPAIVAMLLLATSSQFLIAAMTPYAMTAHLALNLAWLRLVLHRRGWATAAAILTSFVACGLHQMVFHPLFAAPFLPWLWFSGRRRDALIFFVALAAASLFWFAWPAIAPSLALPGAGAEAPTAPVAGAVERVEALIHYSLRPLAAIITADNCARFLAWQNPLTLVLAGATLLSIRRQPGIVWALFGGIAATTAAMILLMPVQGHGWGYRYLHGLLGNFALLAAFGWRGVATAGELPVRRLRFLFGVSLLLSLAVLLPVHAWQAHRFVAPYVEADRRIARIDADVVIVEDRGRWYAADLIRNDPFLHNRPIRLLARKLPLARAADLCRRTRVVILDQSSPELAPLRRVFFRGERVEAARRQQQLRWVGCG